MKYYNEHKAEFVRPEQVALSAVEIKTEGKKGSDIPALKEKANTVRKKAPMAKTSAKSPSVTLTEARRNKAVTLVFTNAANSPRNWKTLCLP